MRQFLIAFVCLSTLAMAQNVVVATPDPVEREPPRIVASAMESDSSRFVPSPLLLDSEAPEPAAMMLLVAGLSGLTAMGGRQRDRRKRRSA